MQRIFNILRDVGKMWDNSHGEYRINFIRIEEKQDRSVLLELYQCSYTLDFQFLSYTLNGRKVADRRVRKTKTTIMYHCWDLKNPFVGNGAPSHLSVEIIKYYGKSSTL